jgi:hypothetical protein
MKQTEAIIAWTPVRWADLRPETAGQVVVLPAPDGAGEARRYMMRAGASSSALAGLTEEARIARLFIDFQTLVVRDGIDPQVAHRAFLAIDEYRFRIAPRRVPSSRIRRRRISGPTRSAARGTRASVRITYAHPAVRALSDGGSRLHGGRPCPCPVAPSSPPQPWRPSPRARPLPPSR